MLFRPITISTASASGTSYSTTFTAAATSNIQPSSIVASLNAGTSVSISTGGASPGSDTGDITVSNTIAKTTGGNATLTLSAYGSVILNADITSSSGTLGLTVTASNGSFSGSGNLSLNGGALSITQATAGTYSGVISGTGTTLTKAGAGEIGRAHV